MELLIIKSGDHYVRFKENQYLMVGIEKATVFPLDQLELVRSHETRLIEKGAKDVRVKKLVLTEEDINP